MFADPSYRLKRAPTGLVLLRGQLVVELVLLGSIIRLVLLLLGMELIGARLLLGILRLKARVARGGFVYLPGLLSLVACLSVAW